MRFPDKALEALLNQPVIVIIDEAQFTGVLTGWSPSEYVIQQDGTEFIVNRRATDMIFADKQEA